MTKRLLLLIALPPALIVFWFTLMFQPQASVDAMWADVERLIR